MTDCIFCKLANGIIPTTKLAENGSAFLIADRNPIAPHHVLCIPNDHYDNVCEPYGLDQAGLLSNMFSLLTNYAEAKGLDKSGFRLVINTGKDAGQTVNHFHIHLIGGATLKNDFGA